MATLADIPSIEQNLINAPFEVINKLYALLYGDGGNKRNRSKVKKFSGFDFAPGDEQYVQKLKFISDNLSLQDLTCVANLLCLNYALEKDDLIKSICDSLINLELLKDNVDSLKSNADDEIEDEGEIVRNDADEIRTVQGSGTWSVEQNINGPCFALSFREIEDTLPKFSGNGGCPLGKWIEEIESNAELMAWTEIQKLIIGKKMLCSVAKLFIQGEPSIKSWNSLKRELLKEFPMKINSAELHATLAATKMQKGESVQEYYLKMKKIASSGRIENESFIHYVINGIYDDEINKAILYGTDELEEFKAKLKIYEKIRSKKMATMKANQRPVAPINKIERNNQEESGNRKKIPYAGARQENVSRCFICGSRDHKANNCSHKDKGMKCFNCNVFGHKSNQCPLKTNEQQMTNRDSNFTMIRKDNKMIKAVMISNVQLNALLDTGSEVSIITENIYAQIKKPNLYPSQVVLTGLGQLSIKVLGYVKENILIDGNELSARIFVVPNNSMKHDMIIGTELINEVELIINKDGIKIRKIEENEIEIMNVVLNNEFEIDVGADISKDTKRKVEKLISNYEPEKTLTTNIEMKIIVKNDEPIFQAPRRLPLVERKIVSKQVDEWIQNKIVEPSVSEYASPVVLTKKKDGAYRMCIDYRKINKIIMKDRFPLPLIEDQIDKLQGYKMFSTIDLKNGFFHVNVSEESRKYTSFVTHDGQFQFLKVPFGLCNSPSVFQRFVNYIFRDLHNQNVALLYMDDIIIPAVDEIEALTRLELVLNKCKAYGLEINKKKCQFLKDKVEYLGHEIIEGKILPSSSKTKAVMHYPEPRTLKQIQSFLGLTGYFRKFIVDYAILAKPLSDLLKKNTHFTFGNKERDSFIKLKQMLAQKPVLMIYNPEAETQLHTDASQDGYGAILMQKSKQDNGYHPIHYMSRKTTDAERKYTSYELEVLAVIEALKKFRIYLLGIKFHIITDCSAFQKTMSKQELSTRIARWALMLEDFDYVIEHRPGTRMKHADALSRYSVMVITTPMVNEQIKRCQLEDNEIKAIKEILKNDPYEDYFQKDDVLFKLVNGEELLVIPKSMQTHLIKVAHEEGHFGVKKTKELLERNYYIAKLKEKIEKYIASCIPCILSSRKQGKQEGLLHPLHKEGLPLQTYHIDHVGPLESTAKNYKYLFIIVDAFTKFIWLYTTKSTTSKEVIDRLEIQRKTFGNPVNIISDRGTAFSSQEFKSYCSENDIKHFMITTGLPRSNGQVERVNSLVLCVLSKLSIDDPCKWYKHVDKVQRAINSTYQRAINTTPFQLLTGVVMKTNDNSEIQNIINAEIQAQFEEERGELRKEAISQIQKIQHENKRAYDKKRKIATKYAINDLVAIKRTQFGPHLKLKPKYIGPYKVTRIKANESYEVEKEGHHEGPIRTSTCAEYMKRWITGCSDDDQSS